MRALTNLGALVGTARQWGAAQRRKNWGLTLHPTDEPTVLAYEGFHGTPSRCHVVHRREGERILFALGHIENGGTSPTNMIQDLASAMWQRFYPEDRFDRIEWFDAWPEHCSLTYHFHIQRVRFRDGEAVLLPVRADVPADFTDEVRRVINARPDLPIAGWMTAFGIIVASALVLGGCSVPAGSVFSGHAALDQLEGHHQGSRG